MYLYQTCVYLHTASGTSSFTAIFKEPFAGLPPRIRGAELDDAELRFKAWPEPAPKKKSNEVNRRCNNDSNSYHDRYNGKNDDMMVIVAIGRMNMVIKKRGRHYLWVVQA